MDIYKEASSFSVQCHHFYSLLFYRNSFLPYVVRVFYVVFWFMKISIGMKYQKHIAGGAGGGIKLYLDFNQTSALSDNNFNRAIRFRSPIAALSVHRLSGV